MLHRDFLKPAVQVVDADRGNLDLRLLLCERPYVLQRFANSDNSPTDPGMITVQDIYRFALFRRASFKLVDGGPYAGSFSRATAALTAVRVSSKLRACSFVEAVSASIAAFFAASARRSSFSLFSSATSFPPTPEIRQRAAKRVLTGPVEIK